MFNQSRCTILLTLDPRRSCYLNVLPGHEIAFIIVLSIVHRRFRRLTGLLRCNRMTSSELVLAITVLCVTATHRTLSARYCLRSEWAVGARVCMSCRRPMRLTHLQKHQASYAIENVTEDLLGCVYLVCELVDTGGNIRQRCLNLG